jgi:hypothetical protein
MVHAKNFTSQQGIASAPHFVTTAKAKKIHEW